MVTVKPKTILAFDLDGTITARSHFEISPNGLGELLNNLSDMGHYVIPVTGKPAAYVEKIFLVNNLKDRGIIAENAGVYRKPESQKIEVYGPSLDELFALREKLGVGMDKVNVTNIFIDGNSYELVIDPDDVSILTIFTDPNYVSHRWNFKHSIDVNTLIEKIQNIIFNNKWDNNLTILPPFPDGAIQVIRKNPDTGKSIDKFFISCVIDVMYPDSKNIPIAMFGDGHNDIPAMTLENIIPITFANADEDVIKFVRVKRGYISKHNAPDGLGVVDGLIWLAKNSFFGDDSENVKSIILKSFPEILNNQKL